MQALLQFKTIACRFPLGRSPGLLPRVAAIPLGNRTMYNFAKYPILAEQVFAQTELSYAFVNLKPVVPGHVLICPKRVVHRFADLTHEEVSDLWLLAQRVGRMIEKYHAATSLTLTVQDGPAAGQTVAHVHVHCLPRKPGDFEPNDKVYDAIDEASKQLPGEKLDLDKERRQRTDAEMAAEAEVLRAEMLAY